MNWGKLLRTEFESVKEGQKISQLVAAIIEDGKITNHYAFGTTKPLTTIFRIASMTKSFAAAAVMQLRDKGLLDLHCPVTEYVPELRTNEQWQDRTTRHLLSMTSGLPPIDDPWADRHLYKSDTWFSELLQHDVLFSENAGEIVQYSNLGFMILGRIISNASGVHALNYIKECLLTPLGMNSTDWNGNIAGYDTDGEEEKEGTVTSDLAVFGGLCTNLEDLSKWINFMVAAFHEDCSQFQSVLGASSRREMQQMTLFPQPKYAGSKENTPAGYGYGLGARFLAGEWFVCHSGGLPGFGSHMLWSPTRNLGLMAFGNVTYAKVAKPCGSVVEQVVSQSSKEFPKPNNGVALISKRGAALCKLIESWDEELAAELFAHNFFFDNKKAEIKEKLASHSVHKKFDVRCEVGFAGSLTTDGEDLLFFSLAPSDGYQIQTLKWLNETE